MEDSLYSFIFRGLLTDTTLDKTERITHNLYSKSIDEEIAKRLSLDLLDPEYVLKSRQMATVYTAIAAFENTLRKFVSKVLYEVSNDSWWDTNVSEKIRTKAKNRIEEEQSIKWHAQRGIDPINYIDFGDTSSIIIQNWDYFEPHFHSQDWIKNMLSMLERSRNVIMHSGQLDKSDIERIGSILRDWVRQTGL